MLMNSVAIYVLIKYCGDKQEKNWILEVFMYKLRKDILTSKDSEHFLNVLQRRHFIV